MHRTPAGAAGVQQQEHGAQHINNDTRRKVLLLVSSNSPSYDAHSLRGRRDPGVNLWIGQQLPQIGDIFFFSRSSIFRTIPEF